MLTRKPRLRALAALCLAVCLLLAGCTVTTGDAPAGDASAPAPSADGSGIRMGLVMQSADNPFYTYMRQGAEEAAARLGVELIALNSNNIEENIKAIEDTMQTGVGAMGFVTYDAKANIPVLEALNAAGIPTFTLDQRVDGGEVVAYIGTDNEYGGRLAGEWLIDQTGGSAKIAILEGTAGSSNNLLRTTGFKEAIAPYPDMEIVASVPANFARDQGMKVMSDILTGHPELTVVFAMNDEMALGAMQALEAAGRNDVLLMGYNGDGQALQAVYDGDMQATVAQYPEEMGRIYVESAYELITQGVYPESDHLKPPITVADTATLRKIVEAVDADGGPVAVGGASEGDIHLALVLADSSNPFYVSLRAGAEAEAVRQGVRLTVLNSRNIEENIKAIEDTMQTGVDAIGIYSFDVKANIPVVEKLNAAGIPVFTVDQRVDGGDIEAFIGTDNEYGGQLAAEWLVEKLSGSGRVAIMEGIPGTATNTLRCQGFLSVLADYPEIEIVTSVAGMNVRDTGMKVMSDIITANPELDAVMCMNDEMAIGAMQALEAAGKLDDVILVGYNGAAEAIQNVRDGAMSATLAQYPEEMGRIFVEHAVRLVREGVHPDTDHLKTPVSVIDTAFAAKVAETISK